MEFVLYLSQFPSLDACYADTQKISKFLLAHPKVCASLPNLYAREKSVLTSPLVRKQSPEFWHIGAFDRPVVAIRAGKAHHLYGIRFAAHLTRKSYQRRGLFQDG